MRTPFRAAAALVALALVAASCDGDSTATTTTTSTSTTTTTTSTTAAPSTTTEPPGPDLRSLLAVFEQTPLRLTYVIRSDGEETRVILSQDPAADPPVQAVIVPEAHAKIVTIGGDSIFCDTADGACLTVAGGVGDGLSAGLLGPVAGLLLADDVPGTLALDASEEVAGRSGLCFTFAPPVDAGFGTDTIRQCIDAAIGFTLLVQIEESPPIVELVEFGEPLADDFVPSGPVADTP